MTIEQHPDNPSGSLVLEADQRRWTDEQLSALHAMGVSEQATQAELDIFRHVAQRSQLDPFSRQIYLVSRKGRAQTEDGWRDVYKSTIQTGIDGYRVIARRAATAAGDSLEYEDVQWCGQDGIWTDVWVNPGPPSAAKVTVLRSGHRFSAVALFAEYAQTKRNRRDEIELTDMWAQRGAGQLAKCAEALALRKAFPLDLAGIYTDEEMGQADNPDGGQVVAGKVVATEADPDDGDLDAAMSPREQEAIYGHASPTRRKIIDLFRELDYKDSAARVARVKACLGDAYDPDKELTDEQEQQLLADLQSELP